MVWVHWRSTRRDGGVRGRRRKRHAPVPRRGGGDRIGGRAGDHGWGPLGIDVETTVRRKGLRRSHSGSRWIAGQGGWSDVRRDGVRDCPPGGPFRLGALMSARRVVILGST